MLKFVFWMLAGVNLLVLAIGQGYLGSFRTETREPARLKNQLQAGKLTLLTQEQATAPSAPPAAEEGSTPPRARVSRRSRRSSRNKTCALVNNYLWITMGLIPVDSGKFAAARAASARLENGPPYRRNRLPACTTPRVPRAAAYGARRDRPDSALSAREYAPSCR